MVGRRRAAWRGRSSRVGTGTGRRLDASRRRSRLAARAGSGAGRRGRAGPAAGSARAASPRRAQAVGVSGERVVIREVRLEERGEVAEGEPASRLVTTDERQFEAELVEAVAQLDIAEPEVPQQGRSEE